MVTEVKAQDELTYIKKVMEDSQRVLVGDAHYYIIWGILIVLSLLGTYAAITLEEFKAIGLIWIVMIGAGWVYSFIRGYRQQRRDRHSSFGGKIINGVWIGSGVAMTLIGFVGSISGAVKWWAITPLMAIIMGTPYLITGIAHGLRWLRNIAFVWWIGGVVMLVWPGTYALLVFAAMMISCQIIPGFVLYRKWKRELGMQE